MSKTQGKSFALKVGSKGEIFPPKEVTKHRDHITIRKIYSIEELLKKKPKVEISYHAWKEFKSKLSEEAEK